jgi:hypothetical protein
VKERPPYWRLIAVLFSAFPLEPSLAMTLYQAACDCLRDEAPSREIGGDTMTARVRNLNTEAVLGGISGPAFEARVESEDGTGTVRFFLTREGAEGVEKPTREWMN